MHIDSGFIVILGLPVFIATLIIGVLLRETAPRIAAALLALAMNLAAVGTIWMRLNEFLAGFQTTRHQVPVVATDHPGMFWFLVTIYAAATLLFLWFGNWYFLRIVLGKGTWPKRN